ncbi:MAG: FAD-binding oxidoreductase [Chloroflexi bacterium]|nr:FAD-binding oxidoreductase [Chloroflexota bacterium]
MSSAPTVAPSLVAFTAAISRELHADAISDQDLAAFSVDGQTPGVAVAPNTLEQLQRLLTEAHNHRLAVIPMGSGHHAASANIPAAYDIALSTVRLARVLEHEPADLTIVVEAGMRLGDLQRLLAGHGQWLPLDPAAAAECTVGGLLSANASGPARHAFGTARDWVIGTRVVHTDGSVTKSGGRVVKSVAGFDMHKLYIGAHGSLGVIAEVAFKLAPLPRLETTAVAAFDSAHAAARFALDVHDRGLSITAMELLSPPAAQSIINDHRWIVLLRVAGGSAAVDRSLRDLSRAASSHNGAMESGDGAVAWDAWRRVFGPSMLSLRASLLPSAAGETLQALDRSLAGAGARLSATVTAGIVRMDLDPPAGAQPRTLISRAGETVRRAGGALIVVAAPPSAKRHIDVFGPLRTDFPIMRRLKREFDPDGILSPGRFVGRL